MTLFDDIALAILGVSALMGFVRGAVREVATVVAALIAALAAVFGLRWVAHAARAALHPAWLADAIAMVIIFLTVYVSLRVLSGGLSRRLHSTRGLGTADRLAGGGLGVVRGLFALGLINLAIQLAPPALGLPDWISNARLYPLSGQCAEWVRKIAPRGSALAKRLTPALEREMDTGAEGSDVGQSSDSGYDARARKGLTIVTEKTR